MSFQNLNPRLDQTDERLKVDASESDLVRRLRQEMVDIAAAISAFEGGEPSDFYRAERQRFVNGEIGAIELHDRVVEYWRRQGP